MTVTYTKEQFEENKVKYNKLVYTKTDKNGTEYYEGICSCPRCNGEGVVYSYVLNGVRIPCHPESGTCYLCGGARVVPAKIKVYTKEHASELESQRINRRIKKQEEVEKNVSAFRQHNYDYNIKLGYKLIDFTVDDWTGLPLHQYTYYRIMKDSGKASLISLMKDLYTESDGVCVSRWIPNKAIHYKEEQK